jgi:hypothetical protein
VKFVIALLKLLLSPINLGLFLYVGNVVRSHFSIRLLGDSVAITQLLRTISSLVDDFGVEAYVAQFLVVFSKCIVL